MIWEWSYVDKQHAWLIWVAAAVVIGLGLLELRSRDAMASFLSPVMGRRLSTQASIGRTIAKLAFILASLIFGVLALMRPQMPGETETTHVSHAADVVFALDTSRSMLAEDAAPNRLTRAKAEISDLVKKFEEDTSRTHRVGLVVFAGRAAEVCPLTPDHGFFNTVLASVDTSSAGRGGTRLGTAIKTAKSAFPTGRGAKIMVLITDGDDQDQYSEEAAKEARDAGIRIITIGLGSETGSQIIMTDPKTGAKKPLEYQGQPVISKLDRKSLEKIAVTTEGAYIPAGTSAVDLSSIMESNITPIVRQAEEESTREIPAEKFVWPVLISLACLLIALWIGAGAGDRRTP